MPKSAKPAKPELNEEQVLEFLEENPRVAVKALKDLTLTEILNAALVSAEGADEDDEEQEEEETPKPAKKGAKAKPAEEEEEEEDGDEEEGDSDEEGEEEEGEEEAERQFPEQEALQALKPKTAAANFKKFFGIEIEPEGAATLLSVAAAVYEGDDVEIDRDTLRTLAKTFDLKVMKADTVETLSEKIKDHIDSVISAGEEGGDEEDEEEAEVSKKGSSIKSELEAIRTDTAAQKTKKIAAAGKIKK